MTDSDSDLDMEGARIDRAMERAIALVWERAPQLPSFAGAWIDHSAREIHLRFVGPGAAQLAHEVGTDIASEIRICPHEVQYTQAELDELGATVSRMLAKDGLFARYGVALGVHVGSNHLHLDLEHTTPDEVVKRIRAAFPEDSLKLSLTTGRWTAY